MQRPRAPEAHPRLSAKETIILDLLSGGEPLYGLRLVALSAGRLKRGTVYVTLGRMEAKGYVVSVADAETSTEGRLPRRLYRPTPLGFRVAKAWSTLSQTLRLAEEQ
jgi:PadR family transcriptional regulator, regulatory protein PadR